VEREGESDSHPLREAATTIIQSAFDRPRVINLSSDMASALCFLFSSPSFSFCHIFVSVSVTSALPSPSPCVDNARQGARRRKQSGESSPKFDYEDGIELRRRPCRRVSGLVDPTGSRFLQRLSRGNYSRRHKSFGFELKHGAEFLAEDSS
jgi:hypothetical protein